MEGITLLMSLIPAVFAAISAAALWWYELDEPTVARMSRELSQRREGQPG